MNAIMMGSEVIFLQFIKLQIGCLLVVLYMVFVYIRATRKGTVKCNRYYDLMMVFCPLSIFFDGLTAYLVNHPAMVSPAVLTLAHGFFFALMDLCVTTLFVYVIDLTTGIRKERRLLVWLPGILTVAATLAFLPRLTYVDGSITRYSMGTSVIISYLSMCLQFLFALGILVSRRHTLEKRKFNGVLPILLLAFVLLILQCIWPEILISALYPVMVMLGIYVNLEDPSMRRLETYNEEMVTGFATLVESRDNSTGGHIRRTREYVQIILREMARKEQYRRILTRDYVKNITEAAPMHDIGKVATPDYILQKPGKLNPQEYEVMKRHAATGAEIIQNSFVNLGNPELLKISYEVARYHHEKWNGLGYPEGLSGEEIPLHARVMAIADVFDAVSARRIYREALPLEECFAIIEQGVGTDFDPELAQLFLDAKEEVIRVYEANKDK